MKSCVLIVPEALRADANAYAATLGLQQPGVEPGLFCAALTSDGVTITHRATRADLLPEHEAMLASLPAELVGQVIVDIADDPETRFAHYATVLAAHGLAAWGEQID